jgi:AcrR family transcriptional regulator
MPKPKARDVDTEQKILDAAQRVFVRRGTAGARMQEIAEEAGVNQALLHYYFRSKDRLADTVFQETAGRLLPGVISALGADAPLETKVERLVHLYIDNVRRAPFIPAYLVAELHQQPERLAAILERAHVSTADGKRVLLALAAQLEAAAAAGTIRRIAPLQFLTSLMGVVVAPFLLRPVLHGVFGMSEDDFAKFLDARRVELPGFVLGALRP